MVSPLSLARPVELALNWIGQDELLRQLLAAWMVLDERDIPFNPRLIGKPGVGKDNPGLCRSQEPEQAGLSVSGHYGYQAGRPDCNAGDRAGRHHSVRWFVHWYLPW